MTRYHSINGKLVAFTAEEETARDAEEAAWASGQAERDLEDLREKRNQLLVETDYFGFSDVTMTDAMAAYRQALRDVPQQAGFPSTITWPTKPE